MVYVFHLETNAYRWRHRNTIAVRQCEQLIVIQHRIQILNPERVDGTVGEEIIFYLMRGRAIDIAIRSMPERDSVAKKVR